MNKEAIYYKSKFDFINLYFQAKKPDYYLFKYKFNQNNINLIKKGLKKNFILYNNTYLNKNILLNTQNIENLQYNKKINYIQEYIKNPLKKKENRISLRIFILVIKHNSNLVTFKYDEGIIFEVNQKGIKSFLYPCYFKNIFDKCNCNNEIDLRINSYIKNIMKDNANYFSCPNKKYVNERFFNLFSFDFIFDNKYIPYLIDYDYDINIPKNFKYFKQLKLNINKEIKNIISLDNIYLFSKTKLWNFQNIYIDNINKSEIIQNQKIENFSLKNRFLNEADPTFVFAYLRNINTHQTNNSIKLFFIIFLILIVNIFIILFFFTN